MNVHLFERIIGERKRLGLTQDQMAAAGGVAKRTYCNYESGARKPPLDFLKKLGDAGANVNYLIYGAGSNTDAVPLAVLEQTSGFVSRLRELARDRQLDALSRECHLSEEKLLLYLNGVELPTLDYLIAICTATRTDLNWLVSGTPAPNPDEAALLDNYRHCPPEGRACIKATSAAFAQSGKGVKKGKAA